MSQHFAGQVAIVTGAGAGMGREHALLLASQGAAVVVNDLAESAQAVVDEISAAGGRAVLSRHDVSDWEQAGELVELAVRELGGLHLVVSNAAIIRNVPFGEMGPEDFEKVMRVNAFGAFNVARRAWPVLVEQGFGRLVLVSSSSAWVSQPLIAHYAASKGAVLGMAKSLAAEGAEHGITVNVLAPGAFTQMSGEMTDETARKQSETMMPARLVAPVVAWLLRRENTHNGEIFEAAAGRAAHNFVGSTKGYWSKDLSIEDLVDHADEVTATDGYTVLETTVQLANWMTMENTGWAAELEKEAGR
ncbi:SDR family NAD(P)-dependent oxidoreductase [Homoserinibacter sp. YIM 151385]|uniref:SDR family NAD(P)-dependent oxidoreductase n=1 Tax=Homoserinibacter sp. YIM 151385 TaxID=2985506 RepID=UPI0022F07649|nr:SDR family NAD(P)-dependent oxidoreductase [Homoserinibacter sp. YIM 151385]WBU37578.1 SDR family NAD(P)-dependent oxidoreductase [Homoserinibacter sp. YIM 151385]